MFDYCTYICIYNIKPHIVDWKTHQRNKQFRDNFCREWRAAILRDCFRAQRITNTAKFSNHVIRSFVYIYSAAFLLPL